MSVNEAETLFNAENSSRVLPFCAGRIMNDPVDGNTVRLAMDGDDKAFSSLFMNTYRYVYTVARHYLSNDEDIYDAIQETYTKVYANIGRLKDPEAFHSWLGKIAENSAKDIISANGRPTSELNDETDEYLNDTSAESSKNEVNMDITAVFSQLSQEDAQLLTYIYYDGFKVTEVARMQGLAATTVYSRLNAAKRRLKQLLKLRGIEKPIYGGDIVALITTVIRNAIGTNLLSAAVADEILQSVTGKKTKAGVVISTVARKQRNAAVLRIASLIVLIVILTVGVFMGVYFAVRSALKGGAPTGGSGSDTIGVSTEVGSTNESSSSENISSENNSIEDISSSELDASSPDQTVSEGNTSTGTSGDISDTNDPDSDDNTPDDNTSSGGTSSQKPSSSVITSSSKPSTSSTTTSSKPSTSNSSTSSATDYPDSNPVSYYTYTVSNSAATITSVNKAISGDVTIPSTLGGYPVKAIGREAFENCTKLNSVVIPNGVTTVDYYAFNNCTNLRSISIPPSVTTMHPAFRNCINLSAVHITDFKAWCNIFADDGNYHELPTYHSRKLYLDGKLVSGEVVVPSGVSFGPIYSPLQFLEDVTSIVISEGVQTNGSMVNIFYGCTNLRSISLPSNFKNAFGFLGGCPSLEEIKISSAHPNYISKGLCVIDKATKTLVSGCDNSTIPSDGSVTSIGRNSFDYCESIESITIPSSVVSIGIHAFTGCGNLKTVYYDGTKEQWDKIDIKTPNSVLLNANIVYLK
ncbi:MAG: sigma-70 family RNA polymerase sigma factor [Clostridia bacterium]|nr:sigma-70 family RNA polymerase sigma factor [Clostridia bacterium]